MERCDTDAAEVKRLTRRIDSLEAENQRLKREAVERVDRYAELQAQVKKAYDSAEHEFKQSKLWEARSVGFESQLAEAKAVEDAAGDLIDSCPRCQGQESSDWPPTEKNILECEQHRPLREALAARGEG